MVSYFQKQVKKFISENKLEEATQLLLTSTNNARDVEIELINLKARLLDLEKNYYNRIISNEEKSIGENRIRVALLNLSYDIEEGISEIDKLKRSVSILPEKTFLTLFEKYFIESYKDSDKERIEKIVIGGQIFLNRKSTFINYHSQVDEFNNCYTFDHVPYYLFNDLEKVTVDYSKYSKNLEELSCGLRNLSYLYFVNNLYGYSKDDYLEFLLPKYRKNIGEGIEAFQNIGIGNLDSFFSNSPSFSIDFFKSELFNQSANDLSVIYENEEFIISRYRTERVLKNSISIKGNNPYQPVFLSNEDEEILKEFQFILNNENDLLIPFLNQNFSKIFGSNYDRIESQVWLRSPFLDTIDPNEKVIFLRNAVVSDWELFNLDISPLNRKSTTIEHLVQKLNYMSKMAKLLKKEAVKEDLKKNGFEYFNPRICLVTTNDGSISHAEWRKLVVNNPDNLNLLSYDELILEMERRIRHKKFSL